MRYPTGITITALLALTACSGDQAAPADSEPAAADENQLHQEVAMAPEASEAAAGPQLPVSACGLTLGQSTADLQSLDNFIGLTEAGSEGYGFTNGQFRCGDTGAIATTTSVTTDPSGEIENHDIVRSIMVTGAGYPIIEGLSIGATLAEATAALSEGTPNCGWLHGSYIELMLENFTIQFNADDYETGLMGQTCDPVSDTVQSTGFQMYRYE